MSAKFRTGCRTNVYVGQMSVSDKCPVTPIIAVPQFGNANIPSIDRNQFTGNFFRSGNMRNAVPGGTGSGADEVPNHSYPQDLVLVGTFAQ